MRSKCDAFECAEQSAFGAADGVPEWAAFWAADGIPEWPAY